MSISPKIVTYISTRADIVNVNLRFTALFFQALPSAQPRKSEYRKQVNTRLVWNDNKHWVWRKVFHFGKVFCVNSTLGVGLPVALFRFLVFLPVPFNPNVGWYILFDLSLCQWMHYWSKCVRLANHFRLIAADSHFSFQCCAHFFFAVCSKTHLFSHSHYNLDREWSKLYTQNYPKYLLCQWEMQSKIYGKKIYTQRNKKKYVRKFLRIWPLSAT